MNDLEIFDKAIGLTRAYAEGIRQGDSQGARHVWVLVMNNVVFGVLSSQFRAQQKATALMVDGLWTELSEGMWKSSAGNILQMSPHDVQ